MRYLFGFLCVCAIGAMPLVGCDDDGGGGGSGGSMGDVFPCTEQGIRDAIAEGSGPHTFDCGGLQTVTTVAEIVIDNDVILDGQGNLTVDAGGEHADSMNDHRVFSVPEGVTAELIGFTVTRGRSFLGGCIDNEGGLTLTRSTVTRCIAPPWDNPMGEPEGGGILSRGTLTLTNSTVSENSADFAGGGVFSSGTGTLMNSTVSGNTHGGIRNWGTMTITNSTVSGNTDVGVENRQRATMTITNSTVSGNAGDGIYTQLATMTMTNSTVSGNTGHAISDNASDVTMTNCTVSGTIHAESGYPDVVSSIALSTTLIDGTCTLVGTREPWTSNGYNIESPGDTCGFDQEGDQVDVSADHLKLGELADNGGPTMTHALGEGSVAIDVIPDEDCAVDTDQRGEPRPADTENGCDVGAFEWQPLNDFCKPFTNYQPACYPECQEWTGYLRSCAEYLDSVADCLEGNDCTTNTCEAAWAAWEFDCIGGP